MLMSWNGTAGYWQLNDWSAARVQDYMLVLYELIDRFGELQARGLVPSGISEATLYNAAAVAHAQAIGNGAIWESYFGGDNFPTGEVTQGWGLLDHGVNVAQAIKSAGTWWRQAANQSAALVNSTHVRIRRLDQYHGSPSGVVQADEHLAGYMPSHGTETCGVMEAAFSYEILGLHLGEGLFFDRAELVAYNAMPAAMTKDLWARNYLSQANEVNLKSVVEDPKIWLTDSPDAAVYGLETNFVCCSANNVQGFPRFAARMHGVSSATGGVAVLFWAPGSTTLALPKGGAATVSVTTDYPFGDDATVTVNAAQGTPVSLRIPGWADKATLSVNGGTPFPVGASAGTFYTLPQPSATSTYLVDFNPSIRVSTVWFNNASAVYRGALLYALQLGFNMTETAHYAFKSADYAILPTTAWNYALEMDPSDPGASMTFTQVSRPASPVPFNSSLWPVEITATARLLPSWVEFNNSAAPPPQSPVDCSSIPGGCGDAIKVRLIPYSSTSIRIAVIPWILPASSSSSSARPADAGNLKGGARRP